LWEGKKTKEEYQRARLRLLWGGRKKNEGEGKKKQMAIMIWKGGRSMVIIHCSSLDTRLVYVADPARPREFYPEN
jgi:hypothetical protein